MEEKKRLTKTSSKREGGLPTRLGIHPDLISQEDIAEKQFTNLGDGGGRKLDFFLNVECYANLMVAARR